VPGFSFVGEGCKLREIPQLPDPKAGIPVFQEGRAFHAGDFAGYTGIGYSRGYTVTGGAGFHEHLGIQGRTEVSTESATAPATESASRR